MVHDGQYAESGHYFSFIHDRACNSWWRFNDHTATQVEEQVVFDESTGGKNNGKCAYSLIYVSQKVASILDKMPLQAYAGME